MVPAQDVRRSVEGVVTNPPTTLGVTVHLSKSGIQPDANSANQCRLAEVGTEARPEVVIPIRTPVEDAGVKSQPMSKRREEKGDEDDCHCEKSNEHSKRDMVWLDTARGLGTTRRSLIRRGDWCRC